MTTEAATRKTLIDEQLRLAGWKLGDPTSVIEEYEVEPTGMAPIHTGADPIGELPMFVSEPPLRYGLTRVDYVLLVRGRIVAVIEAKRTSRDAQLGQEQALQYAQGIQRIQGGALPLVLYTNGHDLWMWEHGFYPPTGVRGYPTPLDLDWFHQRREERRPLSVELIDREIAGRDYQIAAIRAVLERIEAHRTRFLLVMATGTGKTRTAMGLIDVLLRAHWAKRVLFLVDRVALRDQALDAFREHLPDSPYWPHSDGDTIETAWAGNRRLYCTTYPTMLNLIEGGTSPETYISPHFFDLIIADESHRSVFHAYKSVLEWFSGVKLGLTATPVSRPHAKPGDPPDPALADQSVRDTFLLFDAPVGDPTFAYTFREAVDHVPPYLSDFEVLKVRSQYQLEGIKGGVLTLQAQKQLIAEGKDPAELNFEGSDLERKVTNSGTNVLIVREFMEAAIKDPTGTLPGKSIFFAISMGHARRLAQIFDELYPEHVGKLARVLVSEDARVYGKGGLLDQFKKESMPRVAISVDMLDTGVDVPEVVNLVFAKPVFSYTKFWQMIGRGTRVIDPGKRKPWCPEKEKFLIIDCWGNFDFFKMNPKGHTPDETMALPVRLFRARLDALEAALAVGNDLVAGRVVRDLRADLATLSAHNAVVAAAHVVLVPLQDDAFWEHLRADQLGALRTTIAPVLRARPNVEEKGMRFEIAAVGWATATLGDQTANADALRASLVEQISELPLTVNKVAEQKPLIEDAQTAAWWAAAGPIEVLDLATRLAPLMRLRQRPRMPMPHLNLIDSTAIKEKIPFGAEHEGITTSGYRARIEAEVRALVAAHPVMARIAAGEEPTEAEMEELAQILRGLDPTITAEVLRDVYDLRSARLVRLLRHVLGLEQLPTWAEDVFAAFDDFIARHSTLTELQMRFLSTLKTFVLQNRRVERKDLVEAPFTQLHPRGVRGVFTGATLDEVVALATGLVA